MVLLLVLLSTNPFLRTASRLDLEKYSTGFLSSPSAMCSSSTRSMVARTWRSWRSAALRYLDGNASAILTINKLLLHMDGEHRLGIGHHGAGHMFVRADCRLDAQFVGFLLDAHELVGNVAFLDNDHSRHAGT